MSSNFFGAALGPLLAAPLIVWLGWRHMFVAIGLVGFLLVAAFWFFYRPTPQSEKVEVEKKVANKVPLKELMKNSGMWKIVIMWFAAGIINWGFSSWMPIYLVETRNLDILSVGLIASVPALLAGFATILSGILLNKFFKNTEKYYAAGGMLLTTVFLFLMIISDSMVAVVIYWNLVYIFKSCVFSVAFSLPHQLLPKEAIGTGMGMVNTGAQAAGFVAPIVMGFIISATGSYDTAFFFLVACGILSTIAALSINKKDRKVNLKDIKNGYRISFFVVCNMLNSLLLVSLLYGRTTEKAAKTTNENYVELTHILATTQPPTQHRVVLGLVFLFFFR